MKNDFIEEWKDVKGYEGYYMISNLGRVYAIPRKYIANNAICSAGGNIVTISANEYRGDRQYVTLCANTNKCKKYISVLVGEAFLPNPCNKPEIDHILPIKDGGGNEVFNLRWVTREENMNNKMTIETMKNKAAKRRVKQFGLDGIFIREYESVVDASKITGICRTAINNCCNNKPRYKTAGGFIWKFAV